jgi:hypothetical protein
MPNKLKTPQEKHLELLAARQKKYAQESLGMGWFFAIVAGALLLTALIENIKYAIFNLLRRTYKLYRNWDLSRLFRTLRL